MQDVTTELRLFNDYDELRRCIDCKQLRPLGAFHRKKTRRDGLQPFCRACGTLRVQQWRANNQDRHTAACLGCSKEFATAEPNRQYCNKECAAGAAAAAAAARHIKDADERNPERHICAYNNCTNAAVTTKYCDDCRPAAMQEQIQSDLRMSIEAWDYAAMYTALARRVTITEPHDCWEFGTQPYPDVSWSNFTRSKQLHRLVLEVRHGKPLGSQHAHHVCGNNKCVKPDHLQPISHRENMAEMLTRKTLTNRIRDLEDVVRALAPDHPILNVIDVL